MTNFSLKQPYTIIAASLLIAVMGIIAYLKTPIDLFPDSTPPQVAVITVQPGASASNISHKITEVLEKEINSISGLKRIVSSSRDQVSSINAEFEYSKPIGEAVVDVQNAVSRVEAVLPDNILKPAVYRITNTTKPLMTIALSPAQNSSKTLIDIRLLAENQIMKSLLQVEGVADVDFFGANQPEIQISVKKAELDANDLSIAEVIGILRQYNINFPSGNVYSSKNEFIVNSFDEFKNLKEIENVPLKNKNNGILYLRDIADVKLTSKEPSSLYHGNGEKSIAVSVKRLSTVGTVKTITNVRKHLDKLRRDYPDIKFELTTDQSPVIKANVDGMRSSLMQAIILTALVIFIFMADFRAAFVVSVSIPMAFFASLTVLYLTPFTLNMVTLSGLIIAVGMVVDASIVVLENIFRHYREMEKPDAFKATAAGTNEVKLSITAGMMTTVIVLIPVMFTGGYTQQIMRPLNVMICSTLIASLFAALTIVPLMISFLLNKPQRKKNAIERLFSYSDTLILKLSDLYTWLLTIAMRHRFLAIAAALILFMVSMKIVPPLIGKEMMPPMDTGISIISFNVESDYNVNEVEKIIDKVEKIISKNPYIKEISTVAGAEAGQISFGGGGRTTQSVVINTRMIPRNLRKITIWEVDKKWREEITKIPGIRDLMVSEYGATPMSTTKAPLDVIISGPDSGVLSSLADKVIGKLKTVPGLIDIRRSWYVDKTEFRLEPDALKCAIYGVTPMKMAQEVKATLKGYQISSFNLKDYLSIPIRVKYTGKEISSSQDLGDIYIPSKFGFIQLRNIAAIKRNKVQPYITREDQQNTIDITALNSVYTISKVASLAQKKLKDMKIPGGYSIKVAGTMADMNEGNKRMIGALLIGLVLLYMLLLAMFKSFSHPITIMAAIPLAVAGALWGLLIFDKPMCKPAMMGIIFLGGTIVNNSILLLDFIIQARKKGVPRNEAIINSVKLRIRPIMMTTVSTIIGLTPLIMETAVGLERMSPLGIVAAVGLATGTVLTLIFIPIVYSIVDDLSSFFASVWKTVFA